MPLFPVRPTKKISHIQKLSNKIQITNQLSFPIPIHIFHQSDVPIDETWRWHQKRKKRDNQIAVSLSKEEDSSMELDQSWFKRMLNRNRAGLNTSSYANGPSGPCKKWEWNPLTSRDPNGIRHLKIERLENKKRTCGRLVIHLGWKRSIRTFYGHHTETYAS